MHGQQINWDILANQLKVRAHSKIKNEDFEFGRILYISMIKDNRQLKEYLDANAYYGDTIYMTFLNQPERPLGKMSLWINRIKNKKRCSFCCHNERGWLRTDTAEITNDFISGVENVCLEWDKKKIRKESKLFERFYPEEYMYNEPYYLMIRTIIKGKDVFDIDSIESWPFWDELNIRIIQERMKKEEQKE
jgi:hypothetical protein